MVRINIISYIHLATYLFYNMSITTVYYVS